MDPASLARAGSVKLVYKNLAPAPRKAKEPPSTGKLPPGAAVSARDHQLMRLYQELEAATAAAKELGLGLGLAK
jgi:hypothetical protein